MAAGIATISHLQASATKVYPQLEAASKAVAEGVAAEAATAGVPLTTNCCSCKQANAGPGFLQTKLPATTIEAAKSDTAAFGRLPLRKCSTRAFGVYPANSKPLSCEHSSHGQEEANGNHCRTA